MERGRQKNNHIAVPTLININCQCKRRKNERNKVEIILMHLNPEHRLGPRAQALELLDLHEVEDLSERLVVAMLEGVQTQVVLERRVHSGGNVYAWLWQNC